jgi:hypothetical protein
MFPFNAPYPHFLSRLSERSGKVLSDQDAISRRDDVVGQERRADSVPSSEVDVVEARKVEVEILLVTTYACLVITLATLITRFLNSYTAVLGNADGPTCDTVNDSGCCDEKPTTP